MLLTGVLDPAFFAAGRLDLDMTAAEDAMRRIGEPLHLTPVEAAVAVIRIAEASMGNALRLVSIQRGHDPRDFALVVGGGGGAMHGARLGRELGVREIVVPRFPGYFSAFGMLVTEPRRDLVRTEPMPAERADMTAVRALFDELAAEARAYMADLALPATLRFACRIDLRYRGQEHWVTVPVDPARSDMAMIVDAFHEAHRRSFGFRLDGTPVELVSYHLTATAPEPAPVVRAPAATGPAVLPGRRRVRFAEEGWHEAGVWRRDDLPPGTVIAGPAIVEEASSTTVLLPGQVLRVDEAGNLRLREA
jgi:N-methylhydantoinase A